jgi:hypothetical protein
MRNQDTRDPAAEQDHQDWSVLFRLLTEGDQRPWSTEELVRDSDDDENVVIDAIGRLQRGGLVHPTTDGLLYPTRAAIYFEQIREQLPE